jgi:hypothetical protein
MSSVATSAGSSHEAAPPQAPLPFSTLDGLAPTKTVLLTSDPAAADPAGINHAMVLVILTVLVVYVTMVYGPIAAWLVDLFPARIRYTSMSLPYHIGNGWFGGFLPTVAFALVAWSGDMYYGLWYPVIVAVATAVIGAIWLPEASKEGLQ